MSQGIPTICLTVKRTKQIPIVGTNLRAHKEFELEDGTTFTVRDAQGSVLSISAGCLIVLHPISYNELGKNNAAAIGGLETGMYYSAVFYVDPKTIKYPPKLRKAA